MRIIFNNWILFSILILGNPSAFACGGGIVVEEFLCDWEWEDNLFPQIDSNFRLAMWTLGTSYLPIKPTALRRDPHSLDEKTSYSEFVKKIADLALISKKQVPTLAFNYRFLYGSDPCYSNTYSSANLFVDGIASTGISKSNVLDLAILRYQILNLCEGNQKNREEISVLLNAYKYDQTTGDWVAYLKAISKFYQKSYQDALQDFHHLSNSKISWIAEISAYMVARTLLIASQNKWDGYSYPDESNIDQKLLKESELAFNDYLKNYPQGKFAESALAIQRRITFLRSPSELLVMLSIQLDQLFSSNQTNSSEWQSKLQIVIDEIVAKGMVNRLNEIDNSKIVAVPLVTSALALSNELPTSLLVQLLKNIEVYSSKYKNFPGLYQLTKAALLYRLKQFEQVDLSLRGALPENTPTEILTSIDFLRAQTLEILNKPEEARKIWRELSVTYSKAKIHWLSSYTNRGEIRELGLESSGIHNRSWLLGVWATKASDDDLKVILQNSSSTVEGRALARDLLLDRLLLRKDYNEFLKVFSKITDKGHYHEVETSAKILSSQPNDPKGLLNYGYFLFARAIRPQSMCNHGPFATRSPIVENLKKTHNAKSSEKIDPPFFYWRKALDQISDQEPNEVEAKLLYYLIKCFAPTNKAFNCTWLQVDKTENQSKLWFKRLHARYPGSKWAIDTKTYF